MPDSSTAQTTFPTEPIRDAIRAGQSAVVSLSAGESLTPADLVGVLDLSEMRFLTAGKPHDLVSFADQLSAGAAQAGRAGQGEAFRVLTTIDATCKSIVLVILDAHTLSSEATLQFIANAMGIQRRLSVILIGQTGVAGILARGELAPVRRRFTLLSTEAAVAAPDAEGGDGLAVAEAAPAARVVHAKAAEMAPPPERRKLMPIAAGVAAVAAVVAVALMQWRHGSHAVLAEAGGPPRAVAPALRAPVPVAVRPAAVASARPTVQPALATVAAPRAVAAKPPAAPILPALVALPGGTLQMGSRMDRSEQPVHGVSVAPFVMAAQPVSVGMWAVCVSAGACKTAGQGAPDMPVTNVSWDDANVYAAWLSAATGARYRLPTEAEWEYAARAGSLTRYAWGDAMVAGKTACADCNGGQPAGKLAAATAYPANGFGLYAMGGVVAEWVQDCWHKNYDGAPATSRKAWDAAGCGARVLRGGSWESKADDVRTASRDSYDASVRYPTHGFRLVRASAPVLPAAPAGAVLPAAPVGAGIISTNTQSGKS